MRKLLLTLILPLVVLGACSNFDTDEKEIEDKKSVQVPKEKTDVKELDLMGYDKFDLPKSIPTIVLGKWIDEGYTLFTLEDGEELENIIAGAIDEYEKELDDYIEKVMEGETSEEQENNLRDQVYEQSKINKDYSHYIDVFEKNIIKDYEGKDLYIEKLREANELINKNDKEAVSKRVEEASKLRESK